MPSQQPKPYRNGWTRSVSWSPSAWSRIGLHTGLAIVLSIALTGCDLLALFNQNPSERARIEMAELRDLKRAGKISRLEIHKSARRLDAFVGNQKISSLDVKLGFAPVGHKFQQSDGRTPVGRYVIDRKNPNSQFHLSLGISYPNATDLRLAEARGVDPGGDIFIHGQPNRSRVKRRMDDWTEGCIALTNEEMTILYEVVDLGTPVYIYH